MNSLGKWPGNLCKISHDINIENNNKCITHSWQDTSSFYLLFRCVQTFQAVCDLTQFSLSFSQDEEQTARARGPIRVNEKIGKQAVALQPAFNVQVCGTGKEFELIIWSTCVNEVNVALWYHIRSPISNKTFFKKQKRISCI